MLGVAIAAGALSAAAYAASTLLPWPGAFDVGSTAVWRAPPGTIALTFDDGPDPVQTPKILDVLGEHGACATFFLIGSRVASGAALVRRMLAEGHAIGNHTLDHRTLAWRGEAFIEGAIDGAQRAIFDACGRVPDIVRAPFGRRDADFYRVATRLGVQPIFWSRDTLDWTGASARVVAGRLGRARGGDIVLMHDGAARATATVEALCVGLARLAGRGRLPRHRLSARAGRCSPSVT